ncbi:MAG: hypothetical protein HOG49_01015 [Candidatus Scalindua sp.]|jgi:hypothetical protein|nr:hypothetical protein [Candidatus Scalindua sp.]
MKLRIEEEGLGSIVIERRVETVEEVTDLMVLLMQYLTFSKTQIDSVIDYE